jgi:hypothetical protein
MLVGDELSTRLANRLAVIRLALQLLQRDRALTVQQRDYVGSALRAVSQLDQEVLGVLRDGQLP